MSHKQTSSSLKEGKIPFKKRENTNTASHYNDLKYQCASLTHNSQNVKPPSKQVKHTPPLHCEHTGCGTGGVDLCGSTQRGQQ